MATSMIILLVVVFVWSLAWKSVALWKSARRKQMAWYIIMLILNTAGILEIIYIFVISKRKEPAL